MNVIEKEVRGLIRYWSFPVLRPRRFHAYCVGMPKTGTHSLASVLGGYRSVHEPESQYYMRLAMARAAGKLSERQLRKRIRYMGRKLWLEFNSAFFNFPLLEALLEEYPEAKFILSIRDCYSWLDSIINELLGREHGQMEQRFHQFYADSVPRGRYQDGDRAFEEHDLLPLDHWLRGWTYHNEHVLSLVPSARLLVVRTHEIRSDLTRIADFLGIDPATLDAARSHEFKAARKFGLLAELDESYLEECVATYCRPLMGRFFPEIRSLRDAHGYRPQDREAQMQSTVA